VQEAEAIGLLRAGLLGGGHSACFKGNLFAFCLLNYCEMEGGLKF
jgi:hypothetical protein